ncbi:taxane 10-beta-hydroxylase-like [Dioscorea cayenensis subsp. rotundata]|uniref:Taxane 10-beta-hydroxylase-like n=1 Tax=Dioscorea cayennensis subsp. rotundata TaxID=55577 RepID=A0AB40BSI9_DIOCR|nr:taxane 10-beta-hydroxylase-like [Dioscorea cayenensis subsp. rotundata]
MASAQLLALILALLLIIIHLLTKDRKQNKRLPPGSMGIPIIGQSLSLLRAMRTNTGERWIKDRINKYGSICKLSLFGGPTVFLTGPAANKFIFSSDSLTLKQPQSITRIIGSQNMMELIGADHKRVRGAVSYFLKPEILRKYVGKIDEEIRQHFRTNWLSHQQVKPDVSLISRMELFKGIKTYQLKKKSKSIVKGHPCALFLQVSPSMKSLTFNVICSTIFGIKQGTTREALVNEFNKMLAGMWAVPINLPFTHFHNSLKARKKVGKILNRIIVEKRSALQRGECSSEDEDLITYLISLGADKGETLTEEEILDNAVL